MYSPAVFPSKTQNTTKRTLKSMLFSRQLLFFCYLLLYFNRGKVNSLFHYHHKSMDIAIVIFFRINNNSYLSKSQIYKTLSRLFGIKNIGHLRQIIIYQRFARLPSIPSIDGSLLIQNSHPIYIFN